MNNKHNLENSEAFSPANSPAIPLNADPKRVQREAPGDLAEFSEQIRNRDLLEEAMTRQGFIPLATEWWHFDAPGWENMPIKDIEL